MSALDDASRSSWPPDVDPVVADVSKSRRPALDDRQVARSGLLARLAAASDIPLVTVWGPAGYGKTTLVAQWAEQDPRAFAWLSLTPLDNDPVHLLHHLVFAIDGCEALPDDVFDALRRPEPQLETVVQPRLGRALQGGRQPLVVVLDDIHVIEERTSWQALSSVLDHLPAGSQLATVGRTRPALALSARRVGGQVVELGMADLAMDHDESAQLLVRAGLDLDGARADELFERTEGWPAGLQLAALALRGSDLDRPGPSLFTGGQRFTAEYLRDELLDTLPDELVDFLIQSSVLDELTGERCDAVLDITGSGAILEQLTRSGNLFVLPLDDVRERYRYHRLFADLLRAELHARNPARERELHRRAGAECRRVGELDGAIRHAVAAGDGPQAADIVLANALRLAGRGRNSTLGLWLGLFPDDEIEASPSLALSRVIHAVESGDAEVVRYWLAVAAGLDHDGPLADGSPSLEVAVAALRAIFATTDIPQARRDAELVRASPRAGNPWWGTATLILGAVALMEGDLERAAPLLAEAEQDAALTPSAIVVCLAQQAFVLMERDRWDEARVRVERFRVMLDAQGLHTYAVVVTALAVSALMAAHDQDQARAQLDRTRALRVVARLTGLGDRARLQTLTVLALAAQQLDDDTGAEMLVDAAQPLRGAEPSAVLLAGHLDEVAAWLARRSAPAAGEGGGAALSPAELRVLAYLPTHYSLGELGERFFVSRNTIKSQTIAIYRKLGVSSRSEAVRRARELGLIED